MAFVLNWHNSFPRPDVTADPVLFLQASWEYIYSWPLTILAKTYASVSLNGTKPNQYNLRAQALANVSSGGLAPAGGVTPNHDTLYSQAILDLSQVGLPEFN